MKKLLVSSVMAIGIFANAQTLLERYKLDNGSSKGENGTDGQYFGWETDDRASQTRGAVNFNGSNYLSLGNPTIDATNGFTISFWFNPSSTMTGTANHVVLSKRAVCSTGNQLNIIATPSTNTLVISIRKDDGTAVTASTSMTYTPDTWQLVTYVLDNANHRVLAYLNGTLKGFAAYSNTAVSILNFAPSSNLMLATSPCADVDGSVKFKGKIDELRLYSNALTATQITSVFNEASISPASSNLNAADLLVYEDKLDGNCSNNAQVTNIGASATTNRANHANAATQFNGTSAAISTHNKMLVNPLSALQNNYSSLTISAWVKRTGADANNFIISNYYGTNICGNNSNHNGMVLRIFDGKVNFYTTEGAQNASISGESILSLNTWYHVAVRFKQPIASANDIELFVNGVKEVSSISQFTMTNLPKFIPPTNINFNSIGGSITSVNTVCNNDQSMAGAIDDIKIYKGLLKDSEILALSTEQAQEKISTPDVSSNIKLAETFNTFTDSAAFATKYNAKYSGIQFTEDRFGNQNSAIRFAGNNAYINTGINISDVTADADAFAYSVWINPDDLMSNNMIIGHSGDGACENQRQQYFRILDGKVNFSAVFVLGTPSNATTRLFTGETLLMPGTWYHVVVNVNQPINDNNDIQIYINGVRETTVVSGTGTGNLPANLSMLGFGNYLRSTGTPCNTTADASFKGIIDDIRIFDRFLCTEDITQLYLEESPTITGFESKDKKSATASFVYPNPIHEGEINFSQEGNWTLSSINGEVVLRGNGNKAQTNELQKGMYIVKITNTLGVFSNTFVKQ